MASPFIVEREPFLGAMRTAMRVVRSGLQIPILSAVMLEADGNKLTISATNLDQSIEVTVPAETNGASALAVSADRLFRFASNLTLPEIEILLHPSRVVLCKAGRAKAELAAYAPEEWPRLRDNSKAEALSIGAAQLRAFSAFCADTMADDAGSPELSGLCIETDGERMAAASLSATRTSCACITVPSAAPKGRFTIPPFALRLLTTTMPKSGDVQIAAGERLIVATIDGLRIVTKKFERDFMDWRRAVPKSADFRIVVEPHELRAALSRVSAASGQDAVRMEMLGDRMTLHAHGKDGHADDAVSILDGEPSEEVYSGVVVAQACAAIDALLGLNPKTERLELSGAREEKRALRFNLPGDDDNYRISMSVFAPPMIDRARAA